MPNPQHVLRRGAVYYWRRRFPSVVPGSGPGCVLTLSLETKDQDIARRLGAALTNMSDEVFEEIRRGELTPQEARAIMIAVALEQTRTLRRAAIAEKVASTRPAVQGERADRLVGAVYRLLADRGRRASLGDNEASLLASCGLSGDDRLAVATTLEVLRDQEKVPAPAWRLRRLLEEHAPAVEAGARSLAAAEIAFYRGKAAACLEAADGTPRARS